MVLLGATGFTGRLVAEVLAQRAGPESLRWAVAGRSAEKLKGLVADLEVLGVPVPDLIEADCGDATSLLALAERTAVVLSTVGPYLRFGEPVVRACVEKGCDYVYITGEPPFVDQLIAHYDRPAQERGLRLVSCCGFDSIPADLGVYFTVQQLPSDRPISVEAFVQVRAAMSGGTWQSALGILAESGRPTPALDALPAAGGGRRVRAGLARIGRRPELGAWVAPLPTIDAAIVRRSARLLPGYGPDFRYAHYVATSSLVQLLGLAAGAGALVALARIPAARRALARLRPSGSGPSPEQRARGSFRIRLLGRAEDQQVEAEVRGGDPGYTETSTMVAEAALCLAKDRSRLPARYGVLTPAAAMGDRLIERLRRAGISFDLLSPAA